MTPAPEDDRADHAKAIGIASSITTASLAMVIPAGLGYWLDRTWGTVGLFLTLGLLLGMAVGAMQLRTLIRQLNRPPEQNE